MGLFVSREKPLGHRLLACSNQNHLHRLKTWLLWTSVSFSFCFPNSDFIDCTLLGTGRPRDFSDVFRGSFHQLCSHSSEFAVYFRTGLFGLLRERTERTCVVCLYAAALVSDLQNFCFDGREVGRSTIVDQRTIKKPALWLAKKKLATRNAGLWLVVDQSFASSLHLAKLFVLVDGSSFMDSLLRRTNKAISHECHGI